MRKHKVHPAYSFVAFLAFVSMVAVTIIRSHAETAVAQTCRDARERLEQTTFGAMSGKLGAHAVFVRDITTGADLFGQNATVALPLASLTKIMTLRIMQKSVGLNTVYTITPEDLVSEGSIGFMPGDAYTVGELVKATLISSSNNATHMLAHATGLSTESFITAMNAEAKALGLDSLHFESITGLDVNEDTVATASGSARDILMLLAREHADHPAVFAASTHPSETIRSTTGKTIALANTNKAIGYLPLLAASKTGYTDVAGGNLAVLWREPAGHLLGATVLGSTEDGRFADMVRLHDTTNTFVSGTAFISKFCDTQ
jgi:D-alanyl-D-alanine carboxypeptidase